MPNEAPLPFFASGAVAHPGRRLILISYHFPPSLTVGALRWQKFARFVVDRGWGLDVITLDPSAVAQQDEARAHDLPPGVRVYGTPKLPLWEETAEHTLWQVYRRISERIPTGVSSNPPTAAKGGASGLDSIAREELRWRPRSPRDLLRAYWAWAEHARYRKWVRSAASLARRCFEPEVHRAVITSAPPHGTYAAGLRVAHATGLPFVMDMQDPWSAFERLPESIASPVWTVLACRAERRAMEQAALIVANTETARQALCRSYPHLCERVITIMNGTDTDEPLPVPSSPPRNRFVIAYAGTVYTESDPRALFRAVRKVIQGLDLHPEQFGIDMIGHFGTIPIRHIAEDEGVGAFVTLGPARPRREALAFLARASLLVTFPGHNGSYAIPAKVYECARFPAWILALTERGSATDLLLRGTSADVVEPTDTQGLAAVVRERFQQFERGDRPGPLAAERDFSCATQAHAFIDAIEGLLDAQSSGDHASALRWETAPETSGSA